MAKRKYMPEVVNKVFECGIHWESQPFGNNHRGEDLIVRSDKDKSARLDWVVAIADGYVYKTAYGKKMGYAVYIQHQNGYYSVYMHLEKGSIRVKKGQWVKKAQRIGYEGQSGEATGPHLHLAIQPTLTKYVDPYPYLTNEFNLDEVWKQANYITIESKYVRTSPEVKSKNKVKYNKLSKTDKSKCKKDTLGYAKFNKNVVLKLTDFKTDKKGYLWAQYDNYWLCVKDNSGYQVKSV